MARRKGRPLAVRFPVEKLLALWDEQTPDGVIAEALGIGRNQVNKWRNGKFTTLDPYAADRYAVRIGTHPGIIWGEDWWNAALVCV